VSLFILLGVFALIMDSFAVKQWDMGSCSDDIKKLNGENGKEMYDPTMPGFDFKNLPWLLMCTNLLALAMGTVTLCISCFFLSRHIDMRYHKESKRLFNAEKENLLGGLIKAGKSHYGDGWTAEHETMMKAIHQHHHHGGNHNGTNSAPAQGASQFLPEVRHMGGYRQVYSAWPV
jgi:hypothetical protein